MRTSPRLALTLLTTITIGAGVLVSCGSDAAPASPASSPASDDTAGDTAGASSDDTADDTAEDSEADEGSGEATYAIVSDAEVASGLGGTAAVMSAFITDPASATSAAIDAMYSNWFLYEGTIKQNDTAAYLDLEDSLGAFKLAAASADTAGMTVASTSFASAASSYLTQHPG
ncbi:MAG: hypothetical protein RLZZ623_375 [Actinomycetota bacterium]